MTRVKIRGTTNDQAGAENDELRETAQVEKHSKYMDIQLLVGLFFFFFYFSLSISILFEIFNTPPFPLLVVFISLSLCSSWLFAFIYFPFCFYIVILRSTIDDMQQSEMAQVSRG